MQAVVLAGGLGTRLGPSSATVPKVLRRVRDRPFLDLLVGALMAGGVTRVHMCLGHLAGLVEEHLRTRPSWGVDTTCSVETDPCGTAGALRLALPYLDDVVVAVMGDTYIALDYTQVVAALPPAAEALMVASTARCDVEPNVVGARGRVKRYDKAGVPGGWTDTGVAVIRRTALERIPAAPEPTDLAVLWRALIERRTMSYVVTGEPFWDIGTQERLRAFARHPSGPPVAGRALNAEPVLSLSTRPSPPLRRPWPGSAADPAAGRDRAERARRRRSWPATVAGDTLPPGWRPTAPA